MAKRNAQGATFGEWLLVRVGRPGATGDLAAAAKADPKFPRRGSPDDVRKRLIKMQADGDIHGVVDDVPGANSRAGVPKSMEL